MLLFVFYYCIFFFLCRCHSFNPSLCHLSVPFVLSYVTVQGHVACWNLTLTRPQMTVVLCESSCMYTIYCRKVSSVL